MSYTELQEKRGRLVTQAREALDEIKSNTDESRAGELTERHDKIMGEFDKIEALIEREARVEAERMLEATRAALAADGDLLSPEQRALIDGLMAQLGTRCDRGELESLEAAIKALAHGTEAFAAERMNRSIRQALAGRKLDQV